MEAFHPDFRLFVKPKDDGEMAGGVALWVHRRFRVLEHEAFRDDLLDWLEVDLGGFRVRGVCVQPLRGPQRPEGRTGVDPPWHSACRRFQPGSWRPCQPRAQRLGGQGTQRPGPWETDFQGTTWVVHGRSRHLSVVVCPCAGSRAGRGPPHGPPRGPPECHGWSGSIPAGALNLMSNRLEDAQRPGEVRQACCGRPFRPFSTRPRVGWIS